MLHPSYAMIAPLFPNSRLTLHCKVCQIGVVLHTMSFSKVLCCPIDETECTAHAVSQRMPSCLQTSMLALAIMV